MEKILFDTNILIHLVRGNDIAKKIKTLIDSLSDPQLFISVVSLGEVKLGCTVGLADSKGGKTKRIDSQIYLY